jgi:hypothetical protein
MTKIFTQMRKIRVEGIVIKKNTIEDSLTGLVSKLLLDLSCHNYRTETFFFLLHHIRILRYKPVYRLTS